MVWTPPDTFKSIYSQGVIDYVRGDLRYRCDFEGGHRHHSHLHAVAASHPIPASQAENGERSFLAMHMLVHHNISVEQTCSFCLVYVNIVAEAGGSLSHISGTGEGRSLVRLARFKWIQTTSHDHTGEGPCSSRNS